MFLYTRLHSFSLPPIHIHRNVFDSSPGRLCRAASICTSRATLHFSWSSSESLAAHVLGEHQQLVCPLGFYWVWPMKSTVRRARRWQEREAGVFDPFTCQRVRSSGGRKCWLHPPAPGGWSSPGSSLTSFSSSGVGHGKVPALLLAPGHFTTDCCFS